MRNTALAFEPPLSASQIADLRLAASKMTGSTRRVFQAEMPLKYRGFHLRRDSRWSIAYSEELISSTISATLQSTDRHHGTVGQEHCHNQRNA